MNRNRMTGFAAAVVLVLGMAAVGCDTGGGGGRVDARLVGKWEARGVFQGNGIEFTSSSMINYLSGVRAWEHQIFTQGDGIYLRDGTRFGTYSITGNTLVFTMAVYGSWPWSHDRVQRFSWE